MDFRSVVVAYTRDPVTLRTLHEKIGRGFIGLDEADADCVSTSVCLLAIRGAEVVGGLRVVVYKRYHDEDYPHRLVWIDHPVWPPGAGVALTLIRSARAWVNMHHSDVVGRKNIYVNCRRDASELWSRCGYVYLAVPDLFVSLSYPLNGKDEIDFLALHLNSRLEVMAYMSSSGLDYTGVDLERMVDCGSVMAIPISGKVLDNEDIS